MKQQKPGNIYFSPAICEALADDPGYMIELMETAAAVISNRAGDTPNKLLDCNLDAMQAGKGVFWFLLTSSKGDIVISGDAESGDIRNMTAPEFNSTDDISFTELNDIAIG